jgi:hypothetical protein
VVYTMGDAVLGPSLPRKSVYSLVSSTSVGFEDRWPGIPQSYLLFLAVVVDADESEGV